MAQYGKKSTNKVRKAMHEMKRGELKSGRSGKTVKSRKQRSRSDYRKHVKRRGKVPKAKSHR